MPSIHLPISRVYQWWWYCCHRCVFYKKKKTYLTSCGICLTHWHEEEEETLLLTMYIQNSDNDNADF